LVDTSLFPDGPREGGTSVVMSSIMVNDNVIDLTATPGAKSGDPVQCAASPQTSYAKFICHLATGAADSKSNLEVSDTVTNRDGAVNATLTGSLAAGSHAMTAAFAVPSPTLFAQTVLAEALAAEGIAIKPPKNATAPNFASLSRSYSSDTQVAEHVS